MSEFTSITLFHLGGSAVTAPVKTRCVQARLRRSSRRGWYYPGATAERGASDGNAASRLLEHGMRYLPRLA